MSMKVCLLLCAFIAVAVAYPPFFRGGPRFMPMRPPPMMVRPPMPGYGGVGYMGAYGGAYSSDVQGDIIDAQMDHRDTVLDRNPYS